MRSMWWGGVGSGGNYDLGVMIVVARSRAPHPNPPHRSQRLAERGSISRLWLGRRPHQRDGLREIAHVIEGQLKQDRIGARPDQRPDHAWLGMPEAERPGERSERKTAFQICGVAEIFGHEPQLVVAPGLIGQPVEQFGEPIHWSFAPLLPTGAVEWPSVSSSSP